MTQFKTILMTAALLAVPSIAFAQISTSTVTDAVKDKAVEGVMDNLATDDAVTAGKTLLKGGSKEDAAMAVVKGRAEDKVEGLTGTKVDLDDLSKDGMVEAGKDVAIDKAKGSATKFTNGVPAVGGVSTDGVVDAGKDIAMEKAKDSSTSYGDKAAGSAKTYEDKAAGSATSYGDKAAGSATSYGDKAAGSHTSNGSAVIPKSGGTVTQPAAVTSSAAPLNCPSGTKDAGDGTCMITGDWNF